MKCIVIFVAILCCTGGIAKAADIKDTLSIAPLPTVPVERQQDEQTLNSRIIGGWDTAIERFPYTVQVHYNLRLICGGSLLTRRHVLSAASCFVDSAGRPVAVAHYTVRVGTAVLGSGGSTHSLSTYVVHERYNIPARDNDVAIMVLSDLVTLSSRVAVASIPFQGLELPDNSILSHVGWGRTNVNINQPASVLQEVAIRSIRFDVCYQRYSWLSSVTGQQFIVTNNMICSGLLDIGGFTCQGDNGGPLVFHGVVVGITSWGYGCGEPLFPDVNTKVSAYTNWINQTVIQYT